MFFSEQISNSSVGNDDRTHDVLPPGTPVAVPRIAIWPWPDAPGALTAPGLLSALPGQYGSWPVLPGAALAIPPIVTVACLIRAWRSNPSVKGGRA
ncbi:hypothetical protein [Komagataeibacter sp. FNDCF1]|uniref:hypothetical protein n=1 Tax=Komagataeibacter sp. FNDCF1 TaxID=2878681 RepID=UPI001E548D35|nr:hypothetical protein [Komagataeibacter sp. FNDCF1]MCE2563729.1 hypothetical protein [Komagataeibacter sp. FNDCF1]